MCILQPQHSISAKQFCCMHSARSRQWPGGRPGQHTGQAAGSAPAHARSRAAAPASGEERGERGEERRWCARREKSDARAEKVHACPTQRTDHNAVRAYYAAKSGHAVIEGCPSANSQHNCPLSPQFPTHSGRAHNCQHNYSTITVTHIPASSRGSGTTPVRPPVRQHRDSPLPNPIVPNIR
jgi:hypothetical protein